MDLESYFYKSFEYRSYIRTQQPRGQTLNVNRQGYKELYPLGKMLTARQTRFA